MSLRNVIHAAILSSLIAVGLIAASALARAEPALDAEEEAFLGLINAYRAQNGSGPLSLNNQLICAADWHSTDMAQKSYFSHVDSLGRTPFQRIDAFGDDPFTALGENIARTYTTAQSVFEAWKSSPGHDGQMLNPNYNVIGIARASAGTIYGWYWTTDFGRLSGPTSPPSQGCSSAPTPTPTATLAATPTAPIRQTTTPTPTASMTAAPTPTPTRTPTLTPTPSPAIRALSGDVDCDAAVSSLDALYVLRVVAGVAGDAACLARGDTNCDQRLDAVDALGILRYVAGLPPVTTQPGCPAVGLTP